MENRNMESQKEEERGVLAEYARKQYRMSQIAAVCSVMILGVALYTASVFIPKINVTYQNMNLVMEDLQTITSDLAEADLERMITDLNRLVANSEENINTALEKVRAIDIDGLNRAIKNLSDAVEPFAKFFNKFP